MIPDPNDEILAIKHKLSVACGNDIRRIVEETRRHQHESGRKSVPVPLRLQTTMNTTDNPLQRSGELRLGAEAGTAESC